MNSRLQESSPGSAAPTVVAGRLGLTAGRASVIWHPSTTPEGVPTVEILDQTLLPHEIVAVRTSASAVVATAIRTMQVRGAPAIGNAAAMGVALAAHESPADGANPDGQFWAYLDQACTAIAATRPTAVNLFWAVDRMRRTIADLSASGATVVGVRAALDAEAQAILQEDVDACYAIGTHGMALLAEGDSILTHCNAGALATGAWGTALAPIFLAHRAGMVLHVFVDETRPFLQGARLTAWELFDAGVDCTLITDNMAAHFMGQGRVTKVIVGADRIAANGDAANKIGTYGLAILAREHGIPFYVAAPTSTIDCTLMSGEVIPIEYRDPAEVTSFRGVPVAPTGVRALHPAFDVTPARYITAIITEVGVHYPPFGPALAQATGTSRVVRPPA